MAIIIAAIIISATALSYSSFETTVTRTVSGTTTTSIQVSTTTVTTISTTTCSEVGSNATSAFATDCQLGITLGLETDPYITIGQNETLSVSLTNDLTIPRDVNYTGLPALPRGPNLSSAAAYDYVLPLQPACGYPSESSYEPAFFAVYNGSGAPVQLNDSPIPIVSCLSSPGQSYHPFDASQTITEDLSIGGQWMSTDASQPWVNGTYSQFGPGNYTVVAFDPWQQLVERNFTVLSGATTAGSFAHPANESFQFAQATVGKVGSSVAVNATFHSELSEPVSTDLIGIAYPAVTENPEGLPGGVLCCPLVRSYSAAGSAAASNKIGAGPHAQVSSNLLFPSSLNGTYLVKLYIISSNGTLLSPISSVFLQVTGGTADGGQADAGPTFFDNSNGLLYVADSGIDSISVVNGSTDRLVATISLPEIIGNLDFHLYDPGNHELYVGGDNSSVVYEVNTSSNFIAAKLPTTGASLVYDPGNGKIFAFGPSLIHVINDSTNKLIANISGIQGPGGGVYDASSGEILATAYNGTTFAINATSDRIVGRILSSGTIFLDDTDNGLLYISQVNSAGGQSIMALNATTFQQVGPKISVPNSTGVFLLKFVVYDSFNKDIYLYNAPGFGSNGGELIAISTASSSIVASIPVPGVNGGLVIDLPSFLYDQTNGDIYATEVANAHNATIGLLEINASSNTIVSQTFPPDMPLNFVSLDTKDGMLYGAYGFGSSTIFGLNLASGSVTTIEVGTYQGYTLPP
jgi:hypothetical protein